MKPAVSPDTRRQVLEHRRGQSLLDVAALTGQESTPTNQRNAKLIKINKPLEKKPYPPFGG